MTLKWLDGAELWGATGYLARGYASGTAGFETTNFRLSPGTRAYTFNSSELVTPSLGAQNTWIVGFGLNVLSAVTGEWRFLAASVEQCSLEYHDNGDSTFEIKVMRGATEIDRTAEAFPIATWHYFEAKMTIRTGTNGAYEIRHNENSVLSGTLVNLADTGADGCDSHSWGHTSATIAMDDIYICDNQGSTNNDWLGDSVCVALLPTAEGNQNDFTPSTGVDNSALVDDPDTVANATEYVSSDTNAHQDFYAYEDLPATGLGTIFGIRVVTDAAMVSVGNRTLKPKFRAASTSEGDGDDFVVDGTGIIAHTVIMEQDPVALAAWTKTEIDGGEFGVEVVS
jgi:hypothetical protein